MDSGMAGTKKQVTIAVAGVVLIAVLIGGVVWLKSAIDIRKHDRERAAVIEAVVERVAASDAVVVAVDSAVNAEMTASTPEEIAGLSDQVDPAIEGLVGVQEEIGRIEETYKNLDETPLYAVANSVEGRIAMLTVGKRILALDGDTARALALVDAGWKSMIQAHEQGNAAVAAANQHSPQGLIESAFQNNAALDSLASAKEDLLAASEILPSSQIDDAVAYIDLKLEANRLARETDSALAKNDVDGANALIDPYNQAESKAAEAAVKLVASPKELIKEPYDVRIADLLVEYQAARSTTARSDGIVLEAPLNGETPAP